MRHPAQGVICGWLIPDLVLQWFPLCEFSLFDTPRVSSLVVLGFCSQCSHSKASGLDLEFCVGAYIFFSAGQVLLSTLSWCSAHTSMSDCVFLMYLWREMYSMFTYSSTILFSMFLFWKNSSLVWSSPLTYSWDKISKFFYGTSSSVMVHFWPPICCK